MAEGYTGQLVALNENTPAETQTQLATAAKAQADVPLTQAQTQLATAQGADAQAHADLTNTQNQQSQVDLQLARAKSPLELAIISDQLIANTASHISADDPDAEAKWNAAFTALKEQGVTDAGQFIGKYNPKLQERITQGFGADSAVAALAGMNGETQLAATDATGTKGAATSAVDPAQIELALSKLSPQQLAATGQKVNALRVALQAVEQSSNPAQEWNRQAAALGHPEWVGGYNLMRLRGLQAEVNAYGAALDQRQVLGAAGVPAPVIPRDVKEAGGTLYGVNAEGTQATPLTPQGNAGLVGTDPSSGAAIYHNPVTNQETVGTHALGQKPGTTGSSATQWKYQAWLDSHPGDTQGALEYASGRGSKTMGAAQLQIAASAQASRDLSAMNLAGNPPPDPQAFLQQDTEQLIAQWSAANNAQAGAPGGPAATSGGWGAAAQGAPFGSMTQQQQATANRIGRGSTAAVGSPRNPYMPVNDAQLQKLGKGVYFVAPDGSIRQKSW